MSKKRTLCANAFDVPRSELISVLSDLKLAFFKELQLTSTTSLSLTPSNVSIFGGIRSTAANADPLMDSDDLHTLPIADMGIYQDRMQKIQRENLRDPFRDEESVKSLQKTMFGNPYKQDKKVSIDEENEASAADDSMSSTNSSGGSSWTSILGGRKRKPRRRSVSPSPFPLEKIPSLAHGARSVSGKVQVVSLGASTGVPGIPTLRIVVQESFGKILSTEEESDALSRRPGMHDGEDEAEEDEDFRRAMFNSDEMEMDGEDEAARLRADTPMPGGIGLDDDDESMEDMQRAQDLIPPPLAVVNLEDIERRKAELPFLQNDGSADMKTDEYMKHRQGIEQDLEQFNGLTKPVFPSLVYDPTALMELQSIPSTIPERSDPGAPYPPNGVSSDAKSSSRDGGDSIIPTGRTGAEATVVQGLTPIPILSPPASGEHHTPSITALVTDGPDDACAKESVLLSVSSEISTDLPESALSGSSIPTILGEPKRLAASMSSEIPDHNGSTSLLPSSQGTEHRVTGESPLEYRNAIIKELKMEPRSKSLVLLFSFIDRIDA